MAVIASTIAPRTIGQYELLEEIAAGGMSSVHRARHQETGKVVAVKILPPEFAANEVMLQRLRQEFQAQSTVRHPHLVRALDFGWEGQSAYLVMEYVEGEDLRQRIERDGPLPEAEAVRIIGQVVEALHTAHTYGIIHRDVKPENILLTTDGQAKLADLGLAKDLEASLELTRTGKGLGTPNFIAPEQFSDAKHAGILCDVYSAAATLYMALTGVLPFQARTIAGVLKKKFDNELVPPCQLVPGLSARVDWAIRRALRANPVERHASCREFGSALTRDAEAGPLCAESPTPTARNSRAPGNARPAKERRVGVRYPCNLGTACNRGTSIHPGVKGPQDTWEGTVQNLALTGIGVVLKRRFEPNTILSVVLCSADGCLSKQMEMRVTRVRRKTAGTWFHGCVFAEPLSKDELRKFL
jgi:serine/threonine protein kinase